MTTNMVLTLQQQYVLADTEVMWAYEQYTHALAHRKNTSCKLDDARAQMVDVTQTWFKKIEYVRAFLFEI